ncbi:MAG: choice-of-anchor Q domain-containing protein [Planctomycetota bacterium]
MRTAIIISLLLLFSPVTTSYAQTTLHVPTEYPTIQDAITASANGDTVLVAAGTYEENINFSGKEIRLVSSDGAGVTVLDGRRLGSVVTLNQAEGPDTLLQGFTLRNGLANAGGGVYTNGASPTVKFNIIKDNEAAGSTGGGGVYSTGGVAAISCNIICDNLAYQQGGGICAYSTETLISNNIIYGNYVWGNFFGNPPHSDTYGGGIATFNSPNSKMINNVVYDNTVEGDYFTVIPNGGGIYSYYAIPLSNSIVWNNHGGGQVDGYMFTSNINYCDIQGGTTYGSHNINLNPLFNDAAQGDFHLTAESPCIDAGINFAFQQYDTDFEGDKRILDSNGDNNSRVDMGADEFMMIRGDSPTLSEATGGSIHFFLDAGSDDANRIYLILGSISGTVPGTPLPFGYVTLPLNWDWFTELVWNYKTSALFQDFLGTLDAGGQAHAQLNVGPLPPGSAGIILYFAFTCNNPFNIASHPVELLIVP